MCRAKKVMLSILMVFAVLVGLGIGFGQGTSSPTPTPQPDVIIENLARGTEAATPMWQIEVGRRFHNAVGVIVHGGDFVEGEWIVGAHIRPDRHVSLAKDIVHYYQQKYPTRTLVLISCNPGHLTLGIPGVYYAKSNIWVVPDRAVSSEIMELSKQRLGWFDKKAKPSPIPQFMGRWVDDPDTVGNIFEFVVD